MDEEHSQSPQQGQKASQKVSQEDVLRVAELAQLELTSEEQVGMLRDLNAILGHVAQLNQLDTADVPAMAQVSEILPREIFEQLPKGNTEAHGASLRGDDLRMSLDREVVMTSAPDTDGVYFKVPKVIER